MMKQPIPNGRLMYNSGFGIGDIKLLIICMVIGRVDKIVMKIEDIWKELLSENTHIGSFIFVYNKLFPRQKQVFN